MKSLPLIVILAISSWSFAQDVDYANCLKLIKVEVDGELALTASDCVMLIDPNGLVGCHDPYVNETVTNGTWELAGKQHLKVKRDGFVVKYVIHRQTDNEIIISPVDNPHKVMYFAK